MTGEIDETDEHEVDDELEVEDSDDQDIVEGAHEATVVDMDVEKLVARIDKTDADEAARKREVRRRLDELSERRRDDLDDTFNFNLDDDL